MAEHRPWHCGTVGSCGGMGRQHRMAPIPVPTSTHPHSQLWALTVAGLPGAGTLLRLWLCAGHPGMCRAEAVPALAARPAGG